MITFTLHIQLTQYSWFLPFCILFSYLQIYFMTFIFSYYINNIYFQSKHNYSRRSLGAYPQDLREPMHLADLCKRYKFTCRPTV